MASLPPYASKSQIAWYYGFRLICAAIFFFLIFPILVILPLSFNAEDFFTFTPKMLALDAEGYSLKHYRYFFTNPDWQLALKNSFLIAPFAALLAVVFGTLAAIGLSQSHVPCRAAIIAILISPMIVPLIISATGMFFFYSSVGRFATETVGLNQELVNFAKKRAGPRGAGHAVRDHHGDRDIGRVRPFADACGGQSWGRSDQNFFPCADAVDPAGCDFRRPVRFHHLV